MAVALTSTGSFASAILGDSLDEALESFPGAKAVGIDVPIGLPQAEARARAVELTGKSLSAKRIAEGTAGCVPAEPSLGERGRKIAVWY